MELLQKVSRTLTDQWGVQVISRGGSAYTDGNTVVIPALPDDLSWHDMMMARGYCDHESLGHVLHTDWEAIKQVFGALNEGTLSSEASANLAKLHRTWNYIEDIVVERKAAQKYIGAKKNLNYVANEIIKKADMGHPFMKLFVEGRRKICGYNLDCLDYEAEVKKLFGDNIFDRIDAITTTMEAIDLARDMVKVYEDAQKQEDQQNMQAPQAGQGQGDGESQEGQGEGQGDPQEGQGEGQAKSKGKNQDDESEDEQEGQGVGGDEGEDQGGKEKDGQSAGGGDQEDDEADGNSQDESKDESKDEGGEAQDDEVDGEGQGASGDDDDEGGEGDGDGALSNQRSKSDTFSVVDNGPLMNLPPITDADDPFDGIREYLEKAHDKMLDERQYVVFDKSGDTLDTMVEARDLRVFNDLREDLGGFNAVRGKVQNMFMARTQSKWLNGQVEGKVNAKALARIPTGYEDVFRKKIVSRDRDTAVSFLIDSSGSMLGRKVSNAMKAVILLLECLEGTKIKTEALTYTTGNYPSSIDDDSANWGELGRYGRLESVLMKIIKNFNEPYARKVKLRISNYKNQEMNNNADGDAFLVAVNRLMRRTEQRKILIVLSDGVVNTGGVDNAVGRAYLKKLNDDVKKAGKVEVLCFALNAEECKRYYPHVIDITYADDLPTYLFAEMRKILKV